jgi:hypothetical protein
MSNFINLLSKIKLLLILTGLGLLVLFLLPLVFNDTSQLQISPSPSATSQRVISNFPPAQPQEFVEQLSTQTGSLAINSNIEAVKVTIDAEEVQSPEFFAPENTTPFLIESLPAGKHTIRASKLGYLNQTLPIEVSTNKLTDITVILEVDPSLDSIQEAIKEMPVSTDEYFIEHLDSIGKIQTIIRKAPFETYKQQAIEWFKERGINNPEASGILFYPALNIN